MTQEQAKQEARQIVTWIKSTDRNWTAEQAITRRTIERYGIRIDRIENGDLFPVTVRNIAAVLQRNATR